MPASRSVLVEHPAPGGKLRVDPGDEVYLTLPCQIAEGVTVTAPSGRVTKLDPRLREFDGGEDSCARLTVEEVGRHRYAWSISGAEVSGTFRVGRGPAGRKQAKRGRR
jgi:hypothetical protein